MSTNNSLNAQNSDSQRPSDISLTVSQLATEVGSEATKQIIVIFLAHLSSFENELKIETNLSCLKRLAHKYKSSAQIVGAADFAELCAQLENAKTFGHAAPIALKVISGIPFLKETLQNNYRTLL